MTLEDIEENFEGPSWSNRIFFYFFLFSFLLIVLLLVLDIFATINTDFVSNHGSQYNTTELGNKGFFDNERYLLSALVQSLAATIALVITLSLVAVQLAAQSYSARVIDVYKNNPDMWILLSIYIVVIFYGLGLLKVIGIGVAGINMEIAIFAAYFLGFFAFVCLVPYMLKTLDLLKPSTVINLLAAEITKERILESLEKDGEIADKDPVQPIIDMINAALERNDYETVRNGLKAIKNSTNSMLLNVQLKKSKYNVIFQHIFEYLTEIGKRSASVEKEKSTLDTIITLKEIGINAANNQNQCVENVAVSLGKVGKKAIEKSLYEVTGEAATSICQLSYISIENDLPTSAIKTFNDLCILHRIIIQKSGIIFEDYIRELEELGEIIPLNERIHRQMIYDSLEQLHLVAIDKGHDYSASVALQLIKKIDKVYTEEQTSKT